ncbi:alpha/beta fold hydrolase [Sphingomonas spermidinifaciens]|uniref:alpha/beta fold hydrolase n=1 Tax=Sphingomonas spermidinifaciens TaxID=1141889 RepID=UPI0015964926|nr:alpha/beta hydrolase [Sphingomonas spermidinifaciens]
MIDRRHLIAGAAGTAAFLLARPAIAGAVAPVEEDLRVSPTRTTKLSAWRPARSRGTVVFSHGHGSWPTRYEALAARLNAAGWSVIAPVHVDSMRHPDRAKFTMQASFGERIADLNAAIAGVSAEQPVVLVGHSFGTLGALCLGGALGYIAPFRAPRVKAVLGFSTPGKVPGLIQPTAYTTLAVPVMVVTGTEDRVPGFVADPADHLFVSETAPGPAYTIVAKDGGHELVADGAALTRYVPAIEHFLSAYGLGDAKALAALDKWAAPAGDRFVVKAA